MKSLNARTMLNGLVEQVKAELEDLKAANKRLHARNEELQSRVAELEQYSRKNNIEIRGVPETQGEDVVEIVKTIAEKIQIPVSEADLDVVHRVPAKGNVKNLIVRFCSRAKKAEFVAKARKARLQTNEINFHGTNPKPVYINDHLTPANKRLFAKALNLKKENNWRFLWTEDCQIKARKTENSKVHRIRDEADLSIFR